MKAVRKIDSDWKILEIIVFDDIFWNTVIVFVFFVFYKALFKTLFVRKKRVCGKDDHFLSDRKILATDYCRSNPIISEKAWKEILKDTKCNWYAGGDGKNSQVFKDLKFYKGVEMVNIEKYVMDPDDAPNRYCRLAC